MADRTDLEQRIIYLERVVADLQKTLNQITPANADQRGSVPPVPRVNSPQALSAQDEIIFESDVPEPAAQDSDASNLAGVNREEFWLNRLGIGLLLLGVAFLFKYSIDQGWIGPSVRVGFGLALGAGLFALGWQLQQRRSALSQILMGGSIGTFYITGFAAYQLYRLLPYPAAFLWMVAVTVLAFVMSLRSQQAVLSVVGAIGGLGTPFVLYSGQGSSIALVAYTCLILMGASAIYLRQGWQSLLWTTYLGAGLIFSWLVLSTATFRFGPASSEIPGPPYFEQMGLQVGCLIGWATFAVVPLVRVLRQLRSPSLPPKRSPVHPGIYVMSINTPIWFVLATGLIWRLDGHAIGWLTIVTALVYGACGYALRQRSSLKALGSTHWLAAIIMFSGGIAFLVQGHGLLLILALEAFLVHWGARRTSTLLLVLAYPLSAAVSLWLLGRLNVPLEGLLPILNLRALVDLVVMGLLLGASTQIRVKSMAYFYQLVIHLEILMWLWRELSTQGAGPVTVAWGLYALSLLVTGLRQDGPVLRWTGMATLLLAVVKLLLYDLNNLDALWRILLSLGFGAVFLGLSYALQDLWKPKSGVAKIPSLSEGDE